MENRLRETRLLGIRACKWQRILIGSALEKITTAGRYLDLLVIVNAEYSSCHNAKK